MTDEKREKLHWKDYKAVGISKELRDGMARDIAERSKVEWTHAGDTILVPERRLGTNTVVVYECKVLRSTTIEVTP